MTIKKFLVPTCLALLITGIFSLPAFFHKLRASQKQQSVSEKEAKPVVPEYHVPEGWNYSSTNFLPSPNANSQKMIFGGITKMFISGISGEGKMKVACFRQNRHGFMELWRIDPGIIYIKIDVTEGYPMWIEVDVPTEMQIRYGEDVKVPRVEIHLRSIDDINAMK
ncbi:MAG: hypothetical protein V4697_04010 [Patescibacteria group bacterium]